MGCGDLCLLTGKGTRLLRRESGRPRQLDNTRGGPGPDRFDVLTPLVNWVKGGVASDVIPAAHVEDGEIVRTRPLCPYPRVATYNGSGSIDDASNFTCTVP